jgi:hypothetical protein
MKIITALLLILLNSAYSGVYAQEEKPLKIHVGEASVLVFGNNKVQVIGVEYPHIFDCSQPESMCVIHLEDQSKKRFIKGYYTPFADGSLSTKNIMLSISQGKGLVFSKYITDCGDDEYIIINEELSAVDSDYTHNSCPFPDEEDDNAVPYEAIKVDK